MSPVEIFELIVVLLAGAMALYWLAARLHILPSAALMIGGGALAFIPGLPHIALDPQLVLVLFLPPLLMDGAYNTALGRFRRHLPGIVSLAVGAVVFTTLVVGVVAHWLVPDLPWAACFALGAVVAPPDAVSARAVLQGVNLPRRLSTLIEGESLLNDATGLVLFRFAVAAALSGTFEAGAAFGNFLVLTIGGVAAGVAAGAVWIFVIKRIGDQMLTIIASSMLGWFAYLLAERLHVSGVIAAVTAGLILGWYQHVVFSATVRLRGVAFWQTMVFLMEALVFILIGFSLRDVVARVGGVEAVTAHMALPAAAIVVVLVVARFVWLFASDGLLAALRGLGWRRARPLGWRQTTVLGWAGMRGVVTLAVALSVPDTMAGRDLILITAFTVIFATVVVQGSSLGALIRLISPVDNDPPAQLDLPLTEAAIARARNVAVEALAYDVSGNLIHPILLEQSRKRATATEKYATDTEQFMTAFRQHIDVVLKSVAAGRAELLRVHRDGLIEDEVLHNLERDLDIEELGMILQRGE